MHKSCLLRFLGKLQRKSFIMQGPEGIKLLKLVPKANDILFTFTFEADPDFY